MKSLSYLLRILLRLIPLIAVLIVTHTSVKADTLYKWKDARGNTQYGDRPPANVNAQAVNTPKITVISNYADQWKPMKFDDDVVVEKEPEQKAVSSYSKLAFVAPKANQAIRANDGDVSAIISIKPGLKKGHQIAYTIDGKAMGKGSSRTKNFSGLSRGSHTIGVKILDAKGKVLKSSSVTFNVLRFSKLSQKQPELEDAEIQTAAVQVQAVRTFNEARKEQLSN